MSLTAEVVFAVLVVFAAFFAVCAVALFWTNRGGGGIVTVPVPFTERSIDIRGPIAAGALCVLAALFLIRMGVDLYTGSGSRPQDQEVQQDANPSDDSRWSPFGVRLLAAGGQNSEEGWVYLGRTSEPPSEWTFDVREDDRPLVGDRVRANKSMLLRRDHYSDLSGTIVGQFLGIDEPPVIGTIPRGSCAQVTDEVDVGFGALWLKIRPVACS